MPRFSLRYADFTEEPMLGGATPYLQQAQLPNCASRIEFCSDLRAWLAQRDGHGFTRTVRKVVGKLWNESVSVRLTR